MTIPCKDYDCIEKILSTTSGDGLDLIISKEIFHIIEDTYDGAKIKPPAYSSCLTSAWRVLEWIIESCNGDVIIKCLPKPFKNGVWEIRVRDIVLNGDKIEEIICKAALLHLLRVKNK